MSILETNAIGKYSGDNVKIDDALNLKSYDTAGRNGLTSVAGDTIYNTSTQKVEFYNGSAWVATGASSFAIEYLIIAGGGSGGGSNQTGSGGGGAGGYLNSYASETSGRNSSTASTYTTYKDTNYTVTVGAGAASVSGSNYGNIGNNSLFDFAVSIGGGGGGREYRAGKGGGSGGGDGARVSNDGSTGITAQGFDGGGVSTTGSPYAAGGGGGASAEGGTATSSPGAGGNGLSSSITGSAVTRAGGGGGGNYNGAGASGGTGGGGAAGGNTAPHTGTAGTVNTGSGGGGCTNAAASGAGGSGIVILRWATADATIGATRTGLTDGNVQTDGSDSYIVFTAGTGTVSFA